MSPDGEIPPENLTPGPDPMPKTRLSDMVRQIAENPALERITISDLLQSMDARAMGALLLLFAFPNILPSPPGTSGILGLPLVYLTSQMMLGRLPWLPKLIANRSVRREDFAGLLDRADPWLDRVERLLRPRLGLLVSDRAERLIGGLCLLLSVIVMLPIPFGNMLPSLAICMFALGLMERDGAWVIAGTVMSFLSLIVVVSVGWVIIKGTLFVLFGAFG
jgi:hypothetical protein